MSPLVLLSSIFYELINMVMIGKFTVRVIITLSKNQSLNYLFPQTENANCLH